MPPTRSRRSPQPAQTLEERWTLEAQTARNLEALEAESAGDIDRAIGLYERNVSEGFAGDLPYGRLVALYSRRASPADVERVLVRAIEVYSSATTRTAADRRATLRVFKNRLAELKRTHGRTGSVGENVGGRQRVQHKQQQAGAEHGANQPDRLNADDVETQEHAGQESAQQPTQHADDRVSGQ